MGALTLDDIVTLPLVEELRAVIARRTCRTCPDCKASRTRETDAILDEWLERTRG